MDIDPVREACKHGEERYLRVHEEVAHLDLHERERGVAVDLAVLGNDARGGVMERQPHPYLSAILRCNLFAYFVHRHILAPEASSPALDCVRELDVLDSGIVAKASVVHQSHYAVVLSLVFGEIPEAGAQYRERSSLSYVNRAYNDGGLSFWAVHSWGIYDMGSCITRWSTR